MRALILAHDHVSPAGPVGERLRHHGFELDERVVVSAEHFANPNVHFDFAGLPDYDLVVPLGAPWGAWDVECIGNWLEPELAWLLERLRAERPVLGICFGGQLIARALGAEVGRAPNCEIGWRDVWSEEPDLLPGGAWFQFHYDRWQLPDGVREVARNPFASQAFVHGRSLAVQFHPEITADSLRGWLEWGGDAKVEQDGQDPVVMLEQTRAYEADARRRTFTLVDSYLRDIAGLI